MDAYMHVGATITLQKEEDGRIELDVVAHTECSLNNLLSSTIEKFTHGEHTAWFDEFAERLIQSATDPAYRCITLWNSCSVLGINVDGCTGNTRWSAVQIVS